MGGGGVEEEWNSGGVDGGWGASKEVFYSLYTEFAGTIDHNASQGHYFTLSFPAQNVPESCGDLQIAYCQLKIRFGK